MLTAYLDASGDHKSPDVLTVGGYVAPVRSWHRFEKAWRRELDANGIGVFHMTDFLAGERGFEKWKGRADAQMRLLRKLAAIIRSNAHFSSVTSIRLSDWRTVNSQYYLKECRATPYAMTGVQCITKLCDWRAAERLRGDRLEFVFESGDTGKGDLERIIGLANDQIRRAWRRRSIAGQPPLIEPVFKSKALCPLQAADFVAWEQRNAIAKGIPIDQLRESLSELLQVPNKSGVVAVRHIKDYAVRLKIPARDGEHSP